MTKNTPKARDKETVDAIVNRLGQLDVSDEAASLAPLQQLCRDLKIKPADTANECKRRVQQSVLDRFRAQHGDTSSTTNTTPQPPASSSADAIPSVDDVANQLCQLTVNGTTTHLAKLQKSCRDLGLGPTPTGKGSKNVSIENETFADERPCADAFTAPPKDRPRPLQRALWYDKHPLDSASVASGLPRRQRRRRAIDQPVQEGTLSPKARTVSAHKPVLTPRQHLKGVFINIVDFVHAKRNGLPATKYPTASALRRYMKRAGPS
ncbi:uncharacterized protein LTR77_001486 [Saxophila tyrrhenica]|uniref:Uncharacterized protein n=1 Tax=Saxophila tyrrhenica TaxID=1690608 RepID=A0AAV9PKY1_9PEZI|nr:hypothetical protein LTR77_001486 [Saxophila tyrrhenica]